MSNELHIPPSQQSAQGPVAKPGEPVSPTKGVLAPPKAPLESKKAKVEVAESPVVERKPSRKGS